MRESGCDAVKLEGGVEIIETVRKIIDTGIPVMGHLGLIPQSIRQFGSYAVRAKEEAEARKLINDAHALEEAGCFGVVLEKIPAKLSAEVSASLSIPTIGIGGGMCDGQVLVVDDVMGKNKGFVAGATDTGHEGDSGSFAICADSHRLDWQLIQDFAYLAIHDMTVVGKTLVEAFYGKPVAYSYFVGESTGGQQGIMEAQRYPEDYDGILSGCPAINWPRFIPAELWPQIVMCQESNYVSAAKLRAVTQAVIEACDEEDGVKDGVIDDPIACTWNPEQFVGKSVGNEVFTRKDAEVVRKIWDGPRSISGKRLWYGLNRGSDLTALAATSGSPLKGSAFPVSMEWFRYFLTLNPGLEVKDIDYSTYELLFNQSVEEFSEVIGTDNPDLSKFKQRNGKLLILHGLSDHLIPSQGSIEYYEKVQRYMGGENKVSDFARLFLLPGLDHGFNGNAPKPHRQLVLLIEWVEKGITPKYLPVELKDAQGNIECNKNIYPYKKN